MRRVFYLIILAITAVSCNTDAFVEPFEIELSGTEFTVPCSGGRVEIVTSHEDWSVQRISENDSDDPYFDSSRLDDGLKYWSETIGVISWEIERPEPAILVLTIKESVSSDPVCIRIYIGTEYLWKVVTVCVAACPGHADPDENMTK